MLELKRAALMRLFFLLGILWASWIIYASNLSGSFILDDWPNLNPLAQIQVPNHGQEIIKFLANNRSGSSGLSRPISLLSFALQSEHWPNNPFAFKAVNLGLHLANGLLIMLLCRFLVRPLSISEQTQKWLPLLIGGLWLIQPIHVSTVLYTVQRMTLLVTFFSLLSLLGYLKGRWHCQKQLKLGYFLCTFSLVLGGLLAILSKENGILIVLYIAVIEITLFNNQPQPKYWPYWFFILIATPILLAFIYVVFNFQTLVSGHSYRDYSLTEHLLTDSRILIDYITKILFPRPNSFGLFFDDYQVSTGILSPISTLSSLIVIAGLLLCALAYRIKHPVFSFAILWFFAGHALESTIIPLELYFEHRNYLPSLGILFGVCYYFIYFINKVSAKTVKMTFIGLASLYMQGIGFICYQEASLWGNPHQQALIWQSTHTQSKRANELASHTWIDLNNPLKADFYLQNISANDKQDSAAYIIRLELHCYINHISSQDQSNILGLLQQTKTDNATALSAKSIVEQWISGKCQNLTAAYLEQILLTVLSHASGNQKTHLASTLSLFYAYQNQYPSAISILDETIKTSNTSELILLKIRWGIASKQYDKALSWIEEAKNNKSFPFLISLNFKNQLTKMEQDIKTLQTSSLNVMQ